MRYIASLDGVMTVLSGMSNEEQMRDNLDTFVNFVPMNEEEYGLVKEVTSKVLSFPTIPCTALACIGCGQCEGVCPQHLEIISLLKNVSEEFD